MTRAVVDLGCAIAFYRDVLALASKAHRPDGAYLTAGDLRLPVGRRRGGDERPHPDDTHVAARTAMRDRRTRRSRRPALAGNRSEGHSLEVPDPDGHRLERHVGSLATRLTHDRAHSSDDRVIACD